MIFFAFFCAISMDVEGSKLGYHNPYPFRTESGCTIVCTRIADHFAAIMEARAYWRCEGNGQILMPLITEDLGEE